MRFYSLYATFSHFLFFVIFFSSLCTFRVLLDLCTLIGFFYHFDFVSVLMSHQRIVIIFMFNHIIYDLFMHFSQRHISFIIIFFFLCGDTFLCLAASLISLIIIASAHFGFVHQFPPSVPKRDGYPGRHPLRPGEHNSSMGGIHLSTLTMLLGESSYFLSCRQASLQYFNDT